MVEDGYEFFAKRQLVTLFSAPNYCGEFDNAGGMMSVDESLMCSFQVRIRLQRKASTGPTVLPSPCTMVSHKQSSLGGWAAGGEPFGLEKRHF